jgi:hypothetical protein
MRETLDWYGTHLPAREPPGRPGAGRR